MSPILYMPIIAGMSELHDSCILVGLEQIVSNITIVTGLFYASIVSIGIWLLWRAVK